MINKMPKTWETLAKKHIQNAAKLAKRDVQGDADLNIAQFFDLDKNSDSEWAK